jgi:transposase
MFTKLHRNGDANGRPGIGVVPRPNDEHLSGAVPNPHVSEHGERRSFTKEYKLRLIREADACSRSGEIGALLRREGLYSSHLANFRKQFAEGKLVEKRPEQVRAQRKENAATRMRNARRLAALEKENRQLRTLLDLQKKLAEVLGIELDSRQTADRSD